MSAALPAFQPGDRVLVEAVVQHVHDDGDTLVDARVVDGAVMRLLAPASAVHPLPTREAQLRAAAEVCKGLPEFFPIPGNRLYSHRIATHLDAIASSLESTSAPKPPPTLREAAEELSKVYDHVPINDAVGPEKRASITKAWRDLDEALAREGAAK